MLKPKLLLPLGLLLLNACAAPPDPRDEVLYLIDHGQFEDALALAHRQHQEAPDDPEKELLYRRATVAALLQRARVLSFENQDLEALALLEQAQELEPDERIVNDWIRKTRRKIADMYLERAFSLDANGDLHGARINYTEALEYAPQDTSALAGLARTRMLLEYRAGEGQKHYNRGVRTLAEYYLEQALSYFNYAEKYKHAPNVTEDRKGRARELIADSRVSMARGFEAEEMYAAARNEYRMALMRDEDHPEALDGLERMTAEAQAMEHLKNAEMFILRGLFDRAREELDAGEALTEVQKELFQGVRDTISEARLEQMYERAKTLEYDYRYPEAIVAYKELLDEASFFKDARTRVDTLQDYVRRAHELYTGLESARTDEERLGLLEQIELFWPEYEDIQERLKVLRSRVQPEGR